MPSFKDRSTRSADVRTHMTSWTSRAIALCCVPLIAAAACASTDPSTASPSTTDPSTTLRELAPDPDDTPATPLLELDEGTTSDGHLDTGDYETRAETTDEVQSLLGQSQSDVLPGFAGDDAEPLFIGETILGNSLDSADNVDLFVVEFPQELEGSNLVVGTRGSLDTVMGLYTAPSDAEPRLLCQVDDVGTDINAAINMPLRAGTYLFEISAFFGETGDYDIFAETGDEVQSRLGESQSDVLPGFAGDDAEPLFIGETIFGNSLDSADNVDLFVVEFPQELEGSNLVVGTRGSLDTVMGLYTAPSDAEPRLLCQVDDVGTDINAAINMPLRAGTYLFEIWAFFGETGDYEVYAANGPAEEPRTKDRRMALDAIADSGMSAELAACVVDNVDWTQFWTVFLESGGEVEDSSEGMALILDALPNCEEPLRLLMIDGFADSGVSAELAACVASNIDWEAFFIVMIDTDGEIEDSPEGTAVIIEALSDCGEPIRLMIADGMVDSGMSAEVAACVVDNVDWTQFWTVFLESGGVFEDSPEGTAVIIEALSDCGEPIRLMIADGMVESGMSAEFAACVVDNVDWTQFWTVLLESGGEVEDSPEGTAGILDALPNCEEPLRLLMMDEFADSGMSAELAACVVDNIDWIQFWTVFLESTGDLRVPDEMTAAAVEKCTT